VKRKFLARLLKKDLFALIAEQRFFLNQEQKLRKLKPSDF